MIGYVYKCEIANKIYIGKTSGKPLARYKVHLYNAFIYKSKIPIAEALRSVGEENALDCFSVIEEINGENWEELESKLCDRENYWMEKLGTMYPDGYNVNKSYPSKRITNHAPQKPREKVMRKVICIDTGEEFPSMAQVSFSNFCSSVSSCICPQSRYPAIDKLTMQMRRKKMDKKLLCFFRFILFSFPFFYFNRIFIVCPSGRLEEITVSNQFQTLEAFSFGCHCQRN